MDPIMALIMVDAMLQSLDNHIHNLISFGEAIHTSQISIAHLSGYRSAQPPFEILNVNTNSFQKITYQ
jgi:hypothetical protein